MLKLPLDCRAEYIESFLSPHEMRHVYAYLDGFDELKNRRFSFPDGREQVIDTVRYMLADRALLGFEQLPEVWGGGFAWPPCLEQVKRRVESAAGAEFHVCRCLYYESREVGADFHSDYPAYGSVSVVASISLGNDREFAFRRKDNHDAQFRLVLASGSLLIMAENCQETYEHAPPVGVGGVPRFNLTFRRFGWESEAAHAHATASTSAQRI